MLPTSISSAQIRKYRLILEQIQYQLQITKWEDWYQVTHLDLLNLAHQEKLGKDVLRKFGSHANALMKLYPEYSWQIHKFSEASLVRSQQTFSLPSSEATNRAFFEQLSKDLNLSTWEEWYEVSEQAVLERGGGQLIQNDGTFSEALARAFPEHDWKVWKFQKLPYGFWSREENQKAFLDSTAKKLQLKSLEDWHAITEEDVLNCGGSGLLKEHKNSIVRALLAHYPHYEWKLFKFKWTPADLWKEEVHQRRYLEHLKKNFGINKWVDWYNVQASEVHEQGGSLFLQHFKTLCNALMALHPDVKWRPWLFPVVPLGFWNDVKNRKDFMDDLAQKLNFTKWEDWYRVRHQDIVDNGGAAIMRYYSSISELVATIYPENPWRMWDFEQTPKGYWADTANQRKFFDEMAKAFNISSEDDWYNVSTKDITSFGGSTILISAYGGSLSKTLMTVYPEKNWHPWKFTNLKNYWTNAENQRTFCDLLAKHLQFQHWEEWYQVEHDHFVSFGGKSLLRQYEDSIPKMLTTIYKERPWKLFLFEHVLPNYYWDNEDNVRDFLNYATEKLNIKTWEDWYVVTTEKIKSLGATTLLRRYGNLMNILQKFYPDHPWEQQHRVYPSKSHFLLFKMLQDLLPTCSNIHMNYNHENLQFNHSQQVMELDIYIPSLKLAFEYHGYQHYATQGIFDFVDSSSARDHEKRRACESVGITLISIPYWWDESPESLVATIRAVRPDIRYSLPLNFIEAKAKPIPETGPKQSAKPKRFHDSPTHEIPYFLSFGKSIRGNQPQCRGCRRTFTDEKEVRLKVEAVHSSNKRRNNLSFCLNGACLEAANHTDLLRKRHFNYQAFTGKIRVPTDVRENTDLEELKRRCQAALGEIEWIMSGEST
eukprot:TRINITY_DN1335_c0_g4_i6.p1 TRINITY_DN1335_c0_g4~~TRINITY_DN1335_c0_g4_i6.p1  ORF type:complete len:879 (-),score=171.48 TRINITY_DN1335_c0_g4_i6:765-3401(-)